jgi:hypothetical protein
LKRILSLSVSLYLDLRGVTRFKMSLGSPGGAGFYKVGVGVSLELESENLVAGLVLEWFEFSTQKENPRQVRRHS